MNEEDSKLKKFATGLLTTLAIFTFVIPVIPIGGVELYSHYKDHSGVVPAKQTISEPSSSTTIDTADPAASDLTDTSVSGPTSSYDDASSSDSSSDYSSPDYSSDYSSSDNYSGYTNVDGNYIPSPNYSGNTIGGYSPTYTCSDGSYSYAQHSQGACSHHGGISY